MLPKSFLCLEIHMGILEQILFKNSYVVSLIPPSSKSKSQFEFSNNSKGKFSGGSTLCCESTSYRDVHQGNSRLWFDDEDGVLLSYPKIYPIFSYLFLNFICIHIIISCIIIAISFGHWPTSMATFLV